MYCLPQEIETWYIIPALRREISRCLIENFQMSYEKIGSILGISKAAISQYSKGKRAAKIILPKSLEPRILSSCKKLVKENNSSICEIEKLLMYIRKKGLVCSVCSSLKNGVLGNCKEIRFEGDTYKARK